MPGHSGKGPDAHKKEPRDPSTVPTNPPTQQPVWYSEEQIEFAASRSSAYQGLRGVDADIAVAYLHAVAEDPVSFDKAAWVHKVVERYNRDRSTVYKALKARPEPIYIAINEMLQRINCLKGLDGAAALAEAASKVRQKLAEGMDPGRLKNNEIKVITAAKDLAFAAQPARIAARQLADGSVETVAEGQDDQMQDLSAQARKAVSAITHPANHGSDSEQEGRNLDDSQETTPQHARDDKDGQGDASEDVQDVSADPEDPEEPAKTGNKSENSPL